MARRLLKHLIFDEIESMKNSKSEQDNLQVIKDHLKQAAKRREELLRGELSMETAAAKKAPEKEKEFFAKVAKYDEKTFSQTFGMKRETLDKLVERLQSKWLRQVAERAGSYTLRQCLLLTLWKLCSSWSFREMIDNFNSDYEKISNIFQDTTLLIASLKDEVIKFPQTAQMQQQAVQQHQQAAVQGLPNMLGFLGMLQIAISADTVADVQVVIDAQHKFLDAHVDCGGTHQHALVWYNSPLQQQIKDGSISLPNELHLVADGHYTLQTHVMVPYRDDDKAAELEPQQQIFNDILNLSYNQMEQTFDMLRKRFQILYTLEAQEITMTTQLIVACMVLHNIVLSNEGVSTELADNNSKHAKTNGVSNNDLMAIKDEYIKETKEAREKRNKIAQQLSEYVF